MEVDSDIVVNDPADSPGEASTSQVAVKKPKKFRFNFSGKILWAIYFTVDKVAKTMTCKLCPKVFKFKTSASTTHANEHLSSQEHKAYVLANMPEGVDSTFWTEEK